METQCLRLRIQSAKSLVSSSSPRDETPERMGHGPDTLVKETTRRLGKWVCLMYQVNLLVILGTS